MNNQDFSNLEDALELMDDLLEEISYFGDDPLVEALKEKAQLLSIKLNDIFEQGELDV